MRVKAYTDGACSGNPGPGGWGVYLVAENNVGEIIKEEVLYGKNKETTNQIPADIDWINRNISLFIFKKKGNLII